MGLDVYLYRYEDFEKYKELEKSWHKEEDAVEEQILKDLGYTKSREYFGNDKEIWGERDYSASILTHGQEYKIQPNEEFKQKYWAMRKERLAARASELGYVTGGYGDIEPNVEKRKIEYDSSMYPEHMFKIGYLRSSYNSAGTNTYLKATLGRDLYDIFNPNNDGEYEIQPDWERALNVTNEMIHDLKTQLGTYGNLYVEFIDTIHVGSKPAWAEKPTDRSPINKEGALERYKAERDAHRGKDDDGYGNFFGRFYHNKPMQVVGLIPGEGWGGKGVYVIYTDGEATTNFYLQSLEITKEMIEWVLEKPEHEREKYYLHWSA